MFCINCGTQLADDAVFCINCGAKVNQTSAPVETVAPAVEQPAFNQPVFNQTMYGTPVQPVYTQPINGMPENKKKGSKAVIPSVVFGLLALITSVMISVSYFIDGEIGNGINNSVYAVTSIFVIIFAVSKSNISSILKGAMYAVTTVVHIIFFGVDGFKTVFTNLGNAKNGTDYYYLIILLVCLICFYIYMIINIIRSFINAKKASTFMLLCGYLAALLMVAMFVVNLVSDYKEFFAFKFIPVDTGIICLIMADVFAVIARANKQAQ